MKQNAKKEEKKTKYVMCFNRTIFVFLEKDSLVA